jgi:DNA-binding transcriptional MerR regulator
MTGPRAAAIGRKLLRQKRPPQKSFSPAELAAAVGISREEVDAVIEAELLQSALRTSDHNENPRFGETELKRLRIIKRAFDHGFPTEEVRRLVDRGTMITCRDVYEMAERNLPRLRQHVGDSAPAVLTLERLMSACTRRGGRRDCVIIAAIESGDLDSPPRD